jgi:hypothetical protein
MILPSHPKKPTKKKSRQSTPLKLKTRRQRLPNDVRRPPTGTATGDI